MATKAPASGETMNMLPGPFPLVRVRMDDAKGFFVIRTDTNTQENAVIRFKNK